MGWNNAPEYGGGGGGWRSTIGALALMLLVAFAMAMCMQATHAQNNEITGIASVIDGDTLEIHGRRIRLDGIDAPERGARCGRANIHQESANALADRIAGRTIQCAITGAPDRYGRVIARCGAGGEDLNTWLVRQGWARDWPRYSDGAYAAAEAEARQAQRGVWAPSCPQSLWGRRTYAPRN